MVSRRQGGRRRRSSSGRWGDRTIGERAHDRLRERRREGDGVPNLTLIPDERSEF